MGYIVGYVTIAFCSTDIAIAPNGQFAIVTDGNISSRLAFINVSLFSLSGTYTLPKLKVEGPE